MSSFYQSVKRVLIGSPIPSAKADHQRLTKTRALATFSSDPLSSVAYATEEILLVLMTAGTAALHLSLPLALAIAGLLTLVVISYRQTLFAYPGGGGAYVVAKENLGRGPGLVAGAALLVDYVLTVAVSVAAGIAALTSAFPSLAEHRVGLSLLAIALLTTMNLRGIRESSTLFAFPTYAFVFAIFSMLVTAAYGLGSGSFIRVAPPDLPVEHGLTLFLLLRAFSSGCTALTGVEAISNGIPAFQKPESKNAAITLVIMASLSISMFLGITYFAHFHGIVPTADETVVSQLARSVFGNSTLYYVVQFTTMGILVLAANTSYADFPRLSSLLAIDRFLPRQLAIQGDRLVFSNGILLLSGVSGLLIVLFRADTHALIPLYCVGVFLSFTLSQSGMVKHWLSERRKGWIRYAIINGVGGAITGIVTLVFTVTKFSHGAWIIILLIPLLVILFTHIHRHYARVADQLRWTPTALPKAHLGEHTVVLPVSGIHKGILEAANYARSISADVRALYVELEATSTPRLKQEWDQLEKDIPLVVLPSPYRSVLLPVLDYIDKVKAERMDTLVTVIVPEFVTARAWQSLLHNQTAFFLKAALLFKRGVVVTSVRYHLKD